MIHTLNILIAPYIRLLAIFYQLGNYNIDRLSNDREQLRVAYPVSESKSTGGHRKHFSGLGEFRLTAWWPRLPTEV